VKATKTNAPINVTRANVIRTELADRTFRTPEHIAERLKIDCDRSASAYIRDPLGSPQNPPVNPGGQKEHIPT
jgi:hypothetical protein